MQWEVRFLEWTQQNFSCKSIIFSHPYTQGKLFKNIQHQGKSSSHHGLIRVLFRRIIRNTEGYGEIQAWGNCSSYMHMHMHMRAHTHIHIAHALCAHAYAITKPWRESIASCQRLRHVRWTTLLSLMWGVR